MLGKSAFKIWVAIFLTLVVSYLYVLNGDFLGDDINRILYNFELKSYIDVLTGDLADRPLLIVYVKMIVQFFGAHTLVFRLLSLAMHALVAWQIYLFLLELNAKSTNQNKHYIAFFTAIVFALHPLHNQVLTTAIQAGVLFSGFFGLLSIRYYYQGISSKFDSNHRRSLWYYLLGILSKPNLSFIPLFYIFNRKPVQSTSRSKSLIFLSYFLIFLIPLFYYFVLRKNIQGQTLSPLNYFLVQAEVLFTYFKLMVIPYNFHFLYDFPEPSPGFNINWLFVLIHAGIIYLGHRFLKNRTLFVLLVGFYLAFIPESSFFPIRHLAFEHRTYFPMIFLFLLIGTALMSWRPQENLSHGLRTATIAFSCFFILLNQNRNIDIKRYGSWALDTLQHSHSYQYSNFVFTYLLARAGYVEELEPILQRNLALYKNQDYDVLVLLVDLFKDRKNKWSYFSKMREYLNKPNLGHHPRFFINKALIEEFSNQNDSLQELVLVEDALGDQLNYLFSEKETHVTAIQNFKTLGNHLLSDMFVKRYKELNLKSYLRTKAFLYLYFDQNFNDLITEIESGIEKLPNEPQLREALVKVRLKQQGPPGGKKI